MNSNSEKGTNPYLHDPNARQAVDLLVKFMIEKVNPDFSEEDAWEWYIQNRASIEAEKGNKKG